MSDNIEVKSGGLGLSSVVFIVFLTLKLGVGSTAVMGWSWLWVCSPLWIPLLIVLPILLGVALYYVSIEALKPAFPFSRRKFKKVKKLRKSFQKKDIDFNQLAVAMDKIIEHQDTDRFNLMDFDDGISTKKSIRRHKEKTKENKFSIKKWWKDGCRGDTLWQKACSWYREGNKKDNTLFQKVRSWYQNGNKKTEEKKT